MKPTTRKKSKKLSTRAPKIPAKQPELSPGEPQNAPENTLKEKPLLPLLGKQQLFVALYVVDYNGTKAALAAGYSPKSAGRMARHLLKLPHVRAAVDKALREQKEKIGLSAESLIAELALVAYQDMDDFVSVDENGAVHIKTLDALKPGRSRVIKKIRERKITRTDKEGNKTTESTMEYELHDKVKCGELLARHLGILHDKTEITGAEGGPISFTDLERATKLQRLIAMAKKRQNEPGSAKDSGNK